MLALEKLQGKLKVVLFQDLVDGIVLDLVSQSQDVREICLELYELPLQSRNLGFSCRG